MATLIFYLRGSLTVANTPLKSIALCSTNPPQTLTFFLSTSPTFQSHSISSNCIHGVAISSTGSPNHPCHACDTPTDPTCTDTLTHCTADTNCCRIPTCRRTHRTFSPPNSSSSACDRTRRSTRFSGDCNLEWSCIY